MSILIGQKLLKNAKIQMRIMGKFWLENWQFLDKKCDFGTVCSSTTIIFGLLPFDDVSIDTTITELIVDFTKLL